MNISVIGTGYVGLVTGACLSWIGMNVMCMDTDEDKIGKLMEGVIPIYEPGLLDIVKECCSSNRLFFTTDIKKAVDFADIIFITVGTPPNEDDSADLKYVFEAAEEIAKCMDKYKVIVDKSTVPVGTGRQVKKRIKNTLQSHGKNIDFDVVSNPEFLREGTAVKDFIKPDRIVIGAENEKASNLVKGIYNIQILLDIPVMITSLETAEMIKYASNAILAARISYINEIANMCDICNADISVVSRGIGLDRRVGTSFLNPGPGFGGSCFPKDTKALVSFGKSIGYIPKIVESTIDVNYKQRILMFEKIKKVVGRLEDKNISILGAAFKPETDDIREAPSIEIIKLLLQNDVNIKVFDPAAMENLKKLFPEENIEYCSDAYSACERSDCIVLLTEWKGFSSLDFSKLKSIVRTPIFIDLRNVYDSNHVRSEGFYYEGVGKK